MEPLCGVLGFQGRGPGAGTAAAAAAAAEFEGAEAAEAAEAAALLAGGLAEAVPLPLAGMSLATGGRPARDAIRWGLPKTREKYVRTKLG